MKQRVVAFVPAKKISRRLPQKNYRPFAGIEGGLVSLKLRQLLDCKEIGSIVLYTNIDRKDLYIPSDRIFVASRDDDPDCSTREMHLGAVKTLRRLGYENNDIVVWAQVTSPMFTRYDEAISKFKLANAFEGANSLLGVTPVKTFYINEFCLPMNYDWTEEVGYWPRSQTLRPIYEINSSVSVIRLQALEAWGDRIVRPVEMMETGKEESVEIDDLNDFKYAEFLHDQNNRRLQGLA